MSRLFPSARPLLAALVGLLVPAGASALPSDPLDKLYPDDPVAYQDFGRYLAMSGDRMLVSAGGDNTLGAAAGAVYVLDSSTGQQLHKLLASDGHAVHGFGSSVAIDGPYALIGASSDSDNGTRAGAAYVFDVITGQELRKILPADGGRSQYFGHRVAIDGTTAMISAHQDDDHGVASGSVYFYDVTTGQLLDKWVPSDVDDRDYFGSSVAIEGNLALAGAPGADRHGKVGTGMVWVYDLATGTTVRSLFRSDAGDYDSFGSAVAISGSTGLACAHNDDDNGDGSGSGYLFDITTGAFIAKILPEDGQTADRFGYAAAMHGATAVVGAYYADGDEGRSGAAYTFDIVTGQQIEKLLPGDSAYDDRYGFGVAIQDDLVAVGSYQDDDHGPSSGSVYLYSAHPDHLHLVATPNDPHPLEQITLSTYGGVPGGPNLLAVVSWNGSPTFLRVTRGSFNIACRHSIQGLVPSGFTGLQLDFQSVGLAAGGIELSNPASVVFQ